MSISAIREKLVNAPLPLEDAEAGSQRILGKHLDEKGAVLDFPVEYVSGSDSKLTPNFGGNDGLASYRYPAFHQMDLNCKISHDMQLLYQGSDG